MAIYSKLVSCSSYLPERVITNFDLEKIVDTSDEWIFQRTGISSRHIVADDEDVLVLATKSVRNLIEKNNIDLASIDLIICSTTTFPTLFPSVASFLQNEIGAVNAMCFSIQEACSGFIYGSVIVDKFLKSGSYKNAIVVGVETMSRIVDWNDRNTCVLFGDGAGCAFFQAIESDNPVGIIDAACFSSGELSNILYTKKDTNKVYMDGRDVFKYAVLQMSKMIDNILQHNSITIDDIKMIVPHQANVRILEAVAKYVKCDVSKFASTISDCANTSSASIPITLDKMLNDKKIVSGDLIILESVGAGMNSGIILIRV